MRKAIDDPAAHYPFYQFAFSDEGIIVAMNDYFIADLGYPIADVTGKMRIEDLLSPGGKILFQTHFLPLIKMQQKASEIYLSFVTHDQKQLPVLFNMSYVGHDDSYVIYCAGMQISKRNLHERELLKAKNFAEQSTEENHELIAVKEALKSTQQNLEYQLRSLSQKSAQQVELTKVLSHDLKEPLRKIQLFTSLLVHQESGLTLKGVSVIEKINSFVEKVSFLLENLERYNSLDSKKIAYVSIDLREVLLEIESSFEKLVPKVKITLKDLTSLKNDFRFQCDRNLFINLIKELVHYAIRYKSEAADALEVTIVADVMRTNLFIETQNRYQFEDCVRLLISDNGSGFLQSSNPFRLFDRSHLHGEISDVSLAYSQKIVQLLNGQISLESHKENGTAFKILIPINI